MKKTQRTYEVHQTDGSLCGTLATMMDIDEVLFEEEQLIPLHMVALMLGVEKECIEAAYEDAETEEDALSMVALLIAHELVDQWLNYHMEIVSKAKWSK